MKFNRTNKHTMMKILLASLLLLPSMSGTGLASEGTQNRPPVPVHTDKMAVQHILPAHKHTDRCEETAAEPVQITCILDRSGSMRNLADDTIGGYNSFLEKQRQEPGKAEVTTVLFDDQYEKIAEGADLKKIPQMTSKTYYARGMTALLDAVGKTLMDMAGRMEKEGICPAKRRVLVLIMTDGRENASKEYDKASVKAMIDEATSKYHWELLFMGANIDSVSEAASIGIPARRAANYAPSPHGIRQAFGLMGAAASEMRRSGKSGDAKQAEDDER